MEIQGIQLSNLPNGAHFNLMEEVSTLLAALMAEDEAVRVRVETLFNAFRTALNGEDIALKVSQKSLLTDQIAAADNDRDRYYSMLKGLVQNWRNHPAVAAAADILWQSLRDYAIHPSMQIDKGTGLLTNLIGDWQTTHAEYVATLHMTNIVEQLHARNEALKTLAADDAYRALIRRINAHLEIGDAPALTDFAAHLNTRLTSYKLQVLRHSAASGNGGNGYNGGGGSSTETPSAPDTPPVTPPAENPGSGDPNGNTQG